MQRACGGKTAHMWKQEMESFDQIWTKVSISGKSVLGLQHVSRHTTMPRCSPKLEPVAWRDFEQLVARIEQALVGANVVVKSPDRIPSLLTRRLREVDASIRAQVGSATLLITVECRKRRAVQDVTWLEQLSSKKQALGAARTIAVSMRSRCADPLPIQHPAA